MNTDDEQLYICDKCAVQTTINYMVEKDGYLLCNACYDNLEDQTGYCSIQCQVTGCCDQSC